MKKECIQRIMEMISEVYKSGSVLYQQTEKALNKLTIDGAYGLWLMLYTSSSKEKR